MRASWLAVVVLAACQQADAPPAGSGLALVPAPGGLRVEGSGGREIGFGRDRLGVVQSVGRIEGETPRPAPCEGGREAFVTRSGLRLVFEDGSFVGWSGADSAAGRGCA